MRFYLATKSSIEHHNSVNVQKDIISEGTLLELLNNDFIGKNKESPMIQEDFLSLSVELNNNGVNKEFILLDSLRHNEYVEPFFYSSEGSFKNDFFMDVFSHIFFKKKQIG